MTEHHLPSQLEVSPEAPDRNLALELVRVTEAGAMASGRWVGRGDKNGADGAAVKAMRALIHTVSMNGVVVIGEGEKDNAPMLYNGERVGDGTGAECDVAVDPVDGTTLTAKGMANAVSVMAVAERGSMFDPSAVFYMDKLATGPEAADFVDITAPVAVNIKRIAKAKRSRSRTSRWSSWTVRATTAWSRRSGRPGPGSSSSPTAMSRARSWRPVRAPVWTCCWASAGRPRASSRPAR